MKPIISYIEPLKAPSLVEQHALTFATTEYFASRSSRLEDTDCLLIDHDDKKKNFILTVGKCEVIYDPGMIPCAYCGESISSSRHQPDAVDSWGHEFKMPYILEVDGQKISISAGRASYGASAIWTGVLPEISKSGAGHCENRAVAATDFTALAIQHVWKNNYVFFQSELAATQYQVFLANFQVETARAQMVADFKLNKINPQMPEDYIEHPDAPLAPYQRVGLMFTLGRMMSGLTMKQGTGKTAVVINRVSLEAARKKAGILEPGNTKMYRVLIICPPRLRYNWQKEFQKFSTVPGQVVRLAGGADARHRKLLECIREDSRVAFSAGIISIDSLDGMIDALVRVPWDLVVIDESHYIKNPKTLRFKTVIQLRETFAARRRMILTGTPMANTVKDYWPQMEFLGQGASGFLSYEKFGEFHVQYAKPSKQAQMSGVPKKAIGTDNIPLLQERIARLFFEITKEEANLQLPAKVYDVVEVSMTAKQRKVYASLQSSLIAEIESALADTTRTVTADHVLTMLLRLAQVTSGFINVKGEIDPATGALLYPDEIVRIENDDNPKIAAMMEILTDPERDPRGKTIIWANFREDVRRISEALTAAGIRHAGYHAGINHQYRYASAEDAVDALNCIEDCKVLIGTPQSAAEGHNMVGYDTANPDRFDTFVDQEIFFSMNWSMLQRLQAEDRAHRRGTRCVVRITDLVCLGTIDEEIRARVVEKKAAASMMADIRDILVRLASGLSDDDD